MAEKMGRGMAGKIAGKTAKRMDADSGTKNGKAADGDKDRVKDSKHKVRDGEGKTGVDRSGKRLVEDGDALSRQHSGEKRRDGSLPRECKETGGLSAPKKQDGRGLSAGYRRKDFKRDGSYGGRGTKRSTSICPTLNLYGGCQLLDMGYAKQLDFKQRQVEELLKGPCPVKPITGMKDPFHYRNRAHAVSDRDKKGDIIPGIYEGNIHHVAPVEKCLIENQKADEIIGTIRGILKFFKIRTYNEDTGFGPLRHVSICKGFPMGEIMVVLVTASLVSPSKNNFAKALREKYPEITTIVQNINGRGTSMVLGDKEHVLYGEGYTADELHGCRFRISSKSFYQVNSMQTEILYEKALPLSGLTGRELVVDAYCGIGATEIITSKVVGKIIGVELNRGAVRDAVDNVEMNGIDNIRLYCSDAGRSLVNVAEQSENVDVVITDPLRSGSTKELMDTVGKPGAGKVVYVSCNPEMLARDVKYMKKSGYRAVETWPMDMFPKTDHVEMVALLSQQKPDDTIEIDPDPDELDVIAAETKATYEEIKAYVWDKYHLKVSSLYISQIKRKCELEVGQNCNLSKSENPKVLKCPPEKGAAVMDALKHFQTI